MAQRGTFGVGSGTRARRLAARLAFLLGCVLCGAMSGALPAMAAEGAVDKVASRVPKPVVAISASGQCVEDTQFMLRNHMELLKHHRDQTVHQGVRTTQHSLANCVACHASRETGRVTGSKDAFCESCHRFAAVTLDCFECHADRPATGIATNAAPLGGVPR
jgi:cytochrome c